MSAPVIRIFSDLHYRDGESRLQRLEALAPLLDGADRVIFNGDTLDTQSPDTRPGLDEIRATFAPFGSRAVFLSGNHDPDISDTAELSLLDDRVWITHGDVLFDDIAPWSAQRPELAVRVARFSRQFPPQDLARIDTRLRIHRLACEGLASPHPRARRGNLAHLARAAHTLAHPLRPFIMLRAWQTAPALARALALAQRPAARLVVLGHTHYPGVWRHPAGPVVVNTGSFCPPFHNLYVELLGERVRVIRPELRRGEFHPGRVLADFPLAP